MRTGIKFVVTILLTVVCAFLVGELPYFFFDVDKMQVYDITINDQVVGVGYIAAFDPSWPAYFKQFAPSIHDLLNLSHYTYISNGYNYHLLPDLFIRYFYSMKILISSLLLAFVISIILTLLIMMAPLQIRKIVKFIFQGLQAIPDLFYLLLIIVGVIILYEKTHWLFFEIAQYDDKIYGLPILILTFIPTLQIMQYLILDMENELDEPYVEFAKGKGLKKGWILTVHVARNAFITFLVHLKTIFWYALANLIMIEVLLNMSGLMSFLFFRGLKNPEIITISLIMVVLPLVILFFIGEWVMGAKRLTAREEAA
jgi:peptide/nickel transport system permease protein